VGVILASSVLLTAETQQVNTRHSSYSLSGSGPVFALVSVAGTAQQTVVGNNAPNANASPRAMILNYIYSNPAVYLRELSEDLTLSLGVVQYHVWVLFKSGQIVDFPIGRYRRLFVAGMYSQTEQKVISLLREPTTAKILTLLSTRPHSHKELATSLSLTSQDITWHANRLSQMGVIMTNKHGSGKSYSLFDETANIVIKFGKNLGLVQIPFVTLKLSEGHAW
jgi:predicted transcriptional regulator